MDKILIIVTIISSIITTVGYLLNEIKNRKKLIIQFDYGIYFMENKLMDLFAEVLLINKSKHNIIVKKIGFLLDGKALPIEMLKENIENYSTISPEALLEGKIIDEAISERFYSFSNNIVEAGADIKCMFDYNQIRKVMEQFPKSNIEVYCEDTMGRVSRLKLDRKKHFLSLKR